MSVKDNLPRIRSFSFLCFLCVLCDFGVLFSVVQAATPRDELLRLVPDSVGFCFVVQDLRSHAAALQNSPCLEQLGRSPLALKIRKSDDLKKLDSLESKLKEKLGLDWTKLRDDVLGDALVMVYRPGPPGKPEQEQGALLLRARNEKVLADLIERINAVQKEEGDLKDVEERRHKGTVYFRRLEYDQHGECDKPPTFYYAHGAIIVLSSQESMIREIIDCDRAGLSAAVPEPVRRLRELGAERALLAMWINPRAFDAELDSKAFPTSSEHSAALKHFVQYWKALDSVVLSLSPEVREIKVKLGVRARIAEMPSVAQRLFRVGATASEVWKRFPESALLAVGGRIDGAALLDVLGGFLTDPSRQALHAAMNRQLGALFGEEDFARDVLPALGPDWGMCLTAPPAQAKSWIPQALFALRVSTNRTKNPIDRKLLGAPDFAARLLVLAHNNQHPDTPLVLKRSEVDGQEIRYLAGDRALPDGLQPAYGLLQGYLVLSSSLDGLTRFVKPNPSSLSPVGKGGGSEGEADTPVPLLRISVKTWRTYLAEHRESIIPFLAEHHKQSRDEAERQLDGLLTGLQFIERIELRQHAVSGQALFTFSVQTTNALKK